MTYKELNDIKSIFKDYDCKGESTQSGLIGLIWVAC